MLGRAYFYTRDHLGSIRELTDKNGAVVTRLDYDPYGVTSVVSGAVIPDFAYAGMYQHKPSGYYLSATRLYSPSLGRWITRDPIQEQGGLNLYAYCGNNPINEVDPSGLAYNGAPPPFAGNWTWIPNNQDTRSGTWKLEGQNITANWDPEGHWDVVFPNGKLGYDRYGNLIGDGTGVCRHVPYRGPVRLPLPASALAKRVLQSLGTAALVATLANAVSQQGLAEGTAQTVFDGTAGPGVALAQVVDDNTNGSISKGTYNITPYISPYTSQVTSLIKSDYVWVQSLFSN